MSSTNQITCPVIVQILPSLEQGGVERGTIEMAEAIIKRGYRAIVISKGGAMERHLKRLGAQTYRLNVHAKNPLTWMSTRAKLKKILQSEGADIVHVRSRVPAWIALPVARRLGLKTLSTIHSKFTPSGFVKNLYNRKMLKADRVIAISDYVQSVITTHYKSSIQPDRLTVIYRGVDMDVFDPEQVQQQRIIREAIRVNLPEDGPVIMLPARPTAWKGHKILLAAVAALDRRDVTLLLLGAGDGDEKFIKPLERMATDTGLNARLKIAKSSADMPAALMLADVVAMPSIVPEPFGRVAIEAQAMGRPVVAFNHGGAIESIIDQKTGFLAKAGDIVDLTRCLGLALDMSARQRALWAKQSRQHISTNFSKTRMCEKTLALYEEFLP